MLLSLTAPLAYANGDHTGAAHPPAKAAAAHTPTKGASPKATASAQHSAPSSADDSDYTRKIDAYSRGKALLDQAIGYYKSLNKLRKLQRESASPGPGGPPGTGGSGPHHRAPPPPPPNGHSAGATGSDATPDLAHKALREMALVSVYGTAGAYQSEIYYRGGRIEARKHDTLPGGWTITRIEPHRVLVKGPHDQHGEIAFKSPEIIRRELGLDSPNSGGSNPNAPLTAPPSLSQLK